MTCSACKDTSVKLAMAYREAVAAGSALREGSPFSRGKRIAVQIPAAEWEKLAAAVRAITGGDVV